ncbi:MAG: ApeA N-terminal domain 1-containing protein, partial [Thiobacillus sp.]
MMNKKQKIFKGFWWFPECEENKLNGILTIDNTNKIILELEDKIEEKTLKYFINEKTTLLNGITTDKISITLLDCHIANAWMTTIRDGSEIFKTIISCDYAFIGIIYTAQENIKFNELSARYTNFTGWTGIKRPEIDNGKSSININNLEQHQIETKLNDGNKIIIDSYWFPNYFTNVFTNEIILEKFSDVKFKFTSSLIFKDCIEYIFYFRNLISISLHEAIGVLGIHAPTFKDNGIKYIEIYCNFYESNDEKNKLVYHNALFTLKDVNENFKFYLYNFFNKKNILNYIVNVYYEILKSKSSYISEEFLLFTRLIESYHRYNPNMESLDLPKEKFKANRETVLTLIEREELSLQEWL